MIDAWDRGQTCGPVGRAGVLWELSPRSQEVADPTVGERDLALLALVGDLFGNRMDAVTTCPACGEPLEVGLSAAELGAAGAPEPAECVADGYAVRLRPLTHADVVDAVRCGGLDPDALLARGVLAVTRDGEICAVADLPVPARAAVAAALAAADPGADLVIEPACSACGHRWEIGFDPAAYLWTQLDAWALRVLDDVHALAAAYGWTEAEVLELSPRRRRHYLALVGAS